MITHVLCEYTKCAARLICSQENPFRTVTNYLFKIRFNNMISTHVSQVSFPCGFTSSTKIWDALFVPWYINHLFYLDLVTISIGSRVRSFCEKIRLQTGRSRIRSLILGRGKRFLLTAKLLVSTQSLQWYRRPFYGGQAAVA